MYPYLRLAGEILKHRGAGRLDPGEIHRSRHLVWPVDIDMFLELNNGRTLTLFDLGRMAMFVRSGFLRVARARGWAGTVAGASVRYRRRLRMFDRVEMRSRMVGWDARFVYAEQSLWKEGDCCSHALLRLAVTGAEGIVPPAEVAVTMGYAPESPPLPDWIRAWTGAEAERPWPPMPDGE